MISSFFSKTKPINYIVLTGFLVLFYALSLLLNFGHNIQQIPISLELLALAALLFMVFVINEVVRTEKVTEFSSFAMLFFVLFIIVFDSVLLDKNAIYCALFIFLAVWRLLTIKSIKNVKHKIFDATFLVCVASLFYDWALIFLILVFLVINVYERNVAKNWMVPFVAILSVFILTFGVLRLTGDTSFFADHYRFAFGFLENGFFTQKSILGNVIFISIVGIILSLVFLKVRRKGGGKLIPLRILFLTFLLGAALSFLCKEGAATILIAFFPAAVFITNYLETIKKTRIRELLVVAAIIAPLLLFLTRISQ